MHKNIHIRKDYFAVHSRIRYFSLWFCPPLQLTDLSKRLTDWKYTSIGQSRQQQQQLWRSVCLRLQIVRFFPRISAACCCCHSNISSSHLKAEDQSFPFLSLRQSQIDYFAEEKLKRKEKKSRLCIQFEMSSSSFSFPAIETLRRSRAQRMNWISSWATDRGCHMGEYTHIRCTGGLCWA